MEISKKSYYEKSSRQKDSIKENKWFHVLGY